MAGGGVMEKWREIFKENLADAVVDFEERVTCDFDKAADKLCESEIERIMLAELLFCPFGYHAGPHKILDPNPNVLGELDWNVSIIPQLKIGKYRADFAVMVRNFAGRILYMVVECDGHDFHEKTKAQAQRDKKRDRDMLRAGWQVFRFTGSEIFRNVRECVEELDLHGAAWIERDLEERGIIQRRQRRDAGDGDGA